MTAPLQDFSRLCLHSITTKPWPLAEAVRALHSAFADALDSAAEDLDRTAIVRALDALTRRRARKSGGAGKLKPHAQVHDRDDLAAQIDYPADMGGHLRHEGDGGVADDFPHL